MATLRRGNAFSHFITNIITTYISVQYSTIVQLLLQCGVYIRVCVLLGVGNSDTAERRTVAWRIFQGYQRRVRIFFILNTQTSSGDIKFVGRFRKKTTVTLFNAIKNPNETRDTYARVINNDNRLVRRIDNRYE